MTTNPMQVTVERPDEQALVQEADVRLDEARNLVVASQPEYDAAARFLQQIKAKQKELDTTRKAITKPLDQAKKGILDLFRTPLQRLETAESTIKRTMLAYTQEQDRKRKAEEARLRELARKEQEKLERQAAKAEEQGKEEKAEALREQAETMPTPIVATDAPKAQGVSTRKVWKFEVADPKAVPREYLIVDEKKIGKIVRALGGETNIPGIKVYAEEQLAARAS